MQLWGVLRQWFYVLYKKNILIQSKNVLMQDIQILDVKDICTNIVLLYLGRESNVSACE